MTKNYKSILGVLFAALLFAFGSASSASAQASQHYTYEEASSMYWRYQGSGHTAPAPLLAAVFYAQGVTFFWDGSYALDSDTLQGAPWTSAEQDDFDAIFLHTGDMDLAYEGALDLLSPAEKEEAMNGGILGNAGYYNWLGWASNSYATYNPPPGGDDNHDQE